MIDTLVELWVVGVANRVLGDVAIAVLTSKLITLESIVPLPDVEVISDDCDEAAIDIDVSIDRLIGKLIGALDCV